MLYTICIALILVASVLVILAVLVQNPKSGMAANFGASNQVMGVRQTADFLEKFTWGLAIAIVILSLLATMTMPSANISSSKSGVEKALEQAIESNQNLLCPLVWQLLSRYKGDYCIESFHPFVLQWFKRHEPQVVRGQLSCNFFKENPHCDIVLFLMSNLMTNFFTHPDFIAYKYLDLDNPAVIYNRKLFHIMTVVWTIPGKPTYDRFKNKVDVMIFEGFEP